MHTLRIINLNNPQAALRNSLLAGAAILALAVAALFPSQASAHSFHLGDPDKFLDELIEMDASDIADLQADLVEARADITEAISDIEDAKDEVRQAPAGAAIARVAFKAASAAVDSATGQAIKKARKALDKSETLLDERRSAISDAEFQETLSAIRMIRKELIGIEYALDNLADALRDEEP